MTNCYECGAPVTECGIGIFYDDSELQEARALLRDTVNTLYALRDHSQEQGLAATVEQKAIDKIASFLRDKNG